MANNYVRDGKTSPYTASANISSGDFVHLGGGRIGVAMADIANAATGEIALEGVWSLPKDNSNLTLGLATIYIATGSNTITTVSAGTQITNAYVFAAAGTAASTVSMKLLG